MTATLEQTQADRLKQVHLVQQGEEVVITNQGRAGAKMSAMTQAAPLPNRQEWLARLAELRTQLSTGRTGPTVEQILDEDRGD